MNIQSLSTKYIIRRITDADIPDVLALCKGNPLYFQYCPPFVTADSIKSDMAALPTGKTKDDNYYLGFYSAGHLIAVMDLIDGYPNPESAFIGFFMMDQLWQGKNIGSTIISEACHYLKEAGFSEVRLGYAKGNLQSEAFWLKNRFEKTGIETPAENFTSVYMLRRL
ncbi:MAG: GNAT family N-acetyltransferase [Anaerolineaceae bacterium]|nr:GNAT family N-acetyltransferase [Anaerolineaceae bacterium]